MSIRTFGAFFFWILSPVCFFLLLLRVDRLSTRNFVPDISHKRKKRFFFYSFLYLFFISFIRFNFFKYLLRFFVALWTALVLKFDYFIAVLLIDGFNSFSLILCSNASGFWTCVKCLFCLCLSSLLSTFVCSRLWYRMGLKSIESFHVQSVNTICEKRLFGFIG